MKLTVLSDTPLDQKKEQAIRGILAESNCPNESFRGTFGEATFEPRANILRLNNGDIETILEDVIVKDDN